MKPTKQDYDTTRKVLVHLYKSIKAKPYTEPDKTLFLQTIQLMVEWCNAMETEVKMD